ncbi:hypothetical protein F9L33_11325 [Amylibacter sp. SFDW26]|uniref:hypothetical protein n=1 Tax=Amylibacter sp. SFDW26 TaxID=2652722 RepID=UPI001262405B|nr:hypothetical protein [Amylibacter sp. SFDW26]KAB7613939.1 hypothetical protein F9L33_11325 [Amylibacter sp. SFDW26]
MKHYLSAIALSAVASVATAGEGHDHDAKGAVISAADETKVAAFDILSAHVSRKGRVITFKMEANGTAGSAVPDSTGEFGGSSIWAYVWPTNLDPKVVGFEAGTGILALAATNHPDFDDTPLFDENIDGDTGNDGAHWHSHWVVLTPNEECGPGALSVRDIPDGETPQMPATWPGVPMFLDSPGYTPYFDGPTISINVALAASDAAKIDTAAYDGVTAALRVNADLHAPLACVTDVFDVASGDLSLPGKVD